MSKEEVLVRATITGTVTICHLPGVVELCFLIPRDIIKNQVLLDLIDKHYKETM